MGKRKYNTDDEGVVKKAKKSEQNEEVMNGDIDDVKIDQPQKQQHAETNKYKLLKTGGFDIKHFRKELAAKTGQTMALTQFLQVCLNPDNEVDYLLEYLKTGGNSHEILRQVNQDSKKNLSLATPAFHLFHLIILKVQSSLPHMIAITEEACRYFLNNFMSTIEIMISENSGPRHRKIVLKLLTSMVTLNSDLGIEVLSQAPLTPKHLQYITEKPNYKEKDNVRTAFVHFMTSFLVDGHLPLIKALLEKQGLLALVIPGLIHDEGEAVLIFLNILKKNVVDNHFISKSLKLKTFSHQVLHNIFKIFSWKGPQELSQEVKSDMRSEIIVLLSDILSTLFTSHKLGLYFIDNSLGTADVNKNQNLYKAILTLKRPWENEKECETILDIVYKCPDLHRAVINVVEQSFEPQHSPIWGRTTEFVVKLLDKLKPEHVVSRMKSLSTSQVSNFVRFVTLPVPLLRSMQLHLGKDVSISLYCVKILVKMLQTLKRYLQILGMEETQSHIMDLRNKLEYFFPKHLPAPAIIVTLINDIINNKDIEEPPKDYKLPKMNKTESLIYLIDLLLLYNEIQPAFFELLEDNIDMKKILDFSMTLESGNIPLLKFKVVSLWLTLDSSAVSIKNSMFKELFLILLEVYTNDNDHTWIEAKDTLHNFFRNTSIFEGDEDEIYLILYSLRNSKINPTSLIGDIVEYVLSNIKELTAYVRNQIVNFEILDEGSELSLDKLFKDLMEDKNTEDIVFMENKIPSPFIVGCMQYIQTNKEAKKYLKHFLSLYVANLLHCNYSPELTEVLLGDSKLDVRSYVTSWVSQPVSLPNTIVETGNILNNLSKSVLDVEDVALADIFTFLEETSQEESDITVDNLSFKDDTEKYVDNSEIMIWAKYLIFCTVRLSNMEQLNESRQKKITSYFHILIEVAKKRHMVDVCRNIILSLFKNPYVLKIYKPLESKSHSSDLVATKFLLQVITQHSEIINYLEKKHKVLKSYQLKNYNEIVKAFIKINKRKNVNSEHTIEVLKIIGMAYDEDMLIFNKIFNTDVDHCIRDDKEPSFVIEILETLIDKYSKTIIFELQEHILRKCMKLYTELLINKEFIVNLTKLEHTIICYLENKPHEATHLTEDIFKKFFHANTIRKSTSYLASVLLKYNLKFCNTFKDNVSQPEILSQRELTLPLGNAVLSHKQFLIDNKDLLATIFNEYKSNINKFLEKPHKAGQVYITCSPFVTKLVLECMDFQDCQKLFAKIHKFETVELSHINLFYTVFLKMCLNDEGHKKDYFVNFLTSMLHIIVLALKENKDSHILINIVSNVYNIIQICKSVVVFGLNQKSDFQKVIESSIWQNFCKVVLKYSLKVKTVDQGGTAGPQLLFLLTALVKLLYPQEHQDIVLLFDMVTSHSEFLNVMLSHHSSEIKSRLVDFLYTLIQTNKSVMKAPQIPVYLSAYHATRSSCDRLILAILHYYETNGQPVNEYKPYVFGDTAANYYAVRKNRSSTLWGHPTPNRVLNLFDKEVIERTVKKFPVTQTLEYDYKLPANVNRNYEISVSESLKRALIKMNDDGVFKTKAIKDYEGSVKALILKGVHDMLIQTENDPTSVSHADSDDSIYDPVFLFPLLSHLLAPGSVASCFKLLRTGLLSIPVMALSSHCPSMRAAAYHVLHRFCLLLETETRHKNDRLFLTDFINTLRQSLSTAINNGKTDDVAIGNLKNPRLPAVDALYLAKALMVSTAAFDPLYKPVNNFFIAKQLIDFTVVPDFLNLFHDSDVESAERRLWILDVIKDGIKTMTDVNVVFKTMCLKMIMDFYSSVLADRKTQEKILGVLCSLSAIPKASEILISGYGFMSWLHSAVNRIGKEDRPLLKGLLTLIRYMLESMTLNAFYKNTTASKNGKIFAELKINKEIEQDLMMNAYALLQYTNCLELEDLVCYVDIYSILSKRCIKMLTKKQMLILLSKSAVSIKNSESVKLLTKALVMNDASVLCSKNIVNIDVTAEDCLIRNLTRVTRNYLS
ncbi:nucleolar pre-ribosomal-associated protein 1 [Aphomia sociella]